jgi:hypothetical protein
MSLDYIFMWVSAALASSPIWGTLLFELWQGLICPRLVARSEVERRAAAMLARHCDRAAETCATNAHRAWCDGDMFEMAMWGRVGKAIEKRM